MGEVLIFYLHFTDVGTDLFVLIMCFLQPHNAVMYTGFCGGQGGGQEPTPVCPYLSYCNIGALVLVFGGARLVMRAITPSCPWIHPYYGVELFMVS